jgi:hypothetical protein
MSNRAVVDRGARIPSWGGRISRPVATLIIVVACLALSSSAQAVPAAKAPPSRPTVLWGISPSGADPTQPSTRTTFTYSLAKGGTVTDKATIWNQSNTALPLTLYSTDARDTAEGQFGLIGANERAKDAGVWVHLIEHHVIVPANSGRVTTFTVHVPRGASPGDHAGAIVAVLTQPVSDPSGHQVLVEQQVANPVFVRVAGRLVPKLDVDVSSHYHRSPFAIGGGSLDVSYVVRNVGNIRLAAHQNVTVAATFGITLKTVHLKDLPELLPGAKVTRTLHINDVLPWFRLTTTVHLQPYSTDSAGLKDVPPSSGSSSVWAIPWLWLLIAAAVITYVWWRRKRSRPAAPPPVAASPRPADPTDAVAVPVDHGSPG